MRQFEMHPSDQYKSSTEAGQGLKSYFYNKYGFNMLCENELPAPFVSFGTNQKVAYRKWTTHLKHQPQFLPITPTGKGNIKLPTLPQKVKNTVEQLKKAISSKLIEPTPILIRREGSFLTSFTAENVIYPNTVNFIQGKTGVFKSRFAGMLTSAFLHCDKGRNKLGFQLNPGYNCPITVGFADTERNLDHQYPKAMQDIVRWAGYLHTEPPTNFHMFSLVNFSRKERLSALKEFVSYLRSSTTDHILLVLDVVTDMVENFNDPVCSNELIDFQNRLINEENITIINVIHENPFNDKARGHLGTELGNKSSCTFQLNKKGDGVYEMCYKKQRDDAPYNSFFFQFDSETGGLKSATEEAAQLKNKQGKASVEEVRQILGSILIEPKTRKELLDDLVQYLGCSERTIEETIKTIFKQKTTIVDEDGVCYQLHKSKGKEVTYELMPE